MATKKTTKAVSDAQTKKSTKTTKGSSTAANRKGAVTTNLDPGFSSVQTVLGPPKIFDNGFNKGYQNLKFENVRLTFVRLSKFDEDDSNADKGTKSVNVLIKKSAAAYDQMLKYFQIVIAHSDKIPELKKEEVFTKIAKFQTGLFKDGDTYVSSTTGEAYPGTKGHLMLTLKHVAFRNEMGVFQPRKELTLLHRNGSIMRPQEIANEFYSGVWADVEGAITSYRNEKGGVGLTGYLQGALKTLDDESLSMMSTSLTARDDLGELETSLDSPVTADSDDPLAKYKF